MYNGNGVLFAENDLPELYLSKGYPSVQYSTRLTVVNKEAYAAWTAKLVRSEKPVASSEDRFNTIRLKTDYVL